MFIPSSSGGTCATSIGATDCRPVGEIVPSAVPAAAIGTATCGIRPWLTVVELDGRAAHPADEAFRDHRRDKCLCSGRDVALRYCWREVVDHPCRVAAEVAAVLKGRGSSGTPLPCGPGCCLC